MKNFIFKSYSENDTKQFAKSFASKLNNGDIIVLSGDLGSGKTKFTEGFLSYFDLEDEISSPTFTIVNEYKKNDTNIYHFDVYRLEDVDEFYAIGGEEYFETGIQLENKLLIDYFIKEIILYDDRIEIIYKNPLTYSPDYENGQGFSFYTKEIRYTYKIAQRKECVIYDYKITMRI